jgi:hypothetical protein
MNFRLIASGATTRRRERWRHAKLDVTALSEPIERWMDEPPPGLDREQKRFKRIAQNAARWPDMNLADEYESEAPC